LLCPGWLIIVSDGFINKHQLLCGGPEKTNTNMKNTGYPYKSILVVLLLAILLLAWVRHLVF
jgi:hypothetical protein